MVLNRIFTFGLLLAATSSAAVIVTPPTGIGLTIGGVDQTRALVAALGLPTFGPGRNSYIQNGAITLPNLVTISGVSFINNDDPFINFSGGFANLTATTQTFSMSYFSGFVGGPYTLARDSYSDSVTDGNGNGVVTVGLAPSAAFISQPQVNGTNFDGQGNPCNVTGGNGFSGVCNPGGPVLSTALLATPATGFFGTVVSFTLSPGDIYTFNGRVEITNAPEPSTWAMMFVGLGAVAVGAVRRKRAA